MPKIKPNFVDGEPMCSDESCPSYPAYCSGKTGRDPVIDDPCIPGLRQQREIAITRAEAAESKLKDAIRSERKAAIALVNMSGKVSGDGMEAIRESIEIAEEELAKEEALAILYAEKEGSDARKIICRMSGVRCRSISGVSKLR